MSKKSDEIAKEIEALQEQYRAAMKQERDADLADVKSKIRRHGFNLRELGVNARTKRAKA